MAVADLRQTTSPGSASPEALAKVFNDTLWADLENSGLFTMVSKSFYPQNLPGSPADLPGPAMAAWARTAHYRGGAGIRYAHHHGRSPGG